MNALSRREEDTLLKTTKARALKECDPAVKGTSPIESSFFLSTFPSVCTVCAGADALSCLGLQRQVQVATRVHASIVCFHSVTSFDRKMTCFYSLQYRPRGHGNSTQGIPPSTRSECSPTIKTNPSGQFRSNCGTIKVLLRSRKVVMHDGPGSRMRPIKNE